MILRFIRSIFPPFLIDQPPLRTEQYMPLPAGYQMNSHGWIFETTSGQSYGPYKMNAAGTMVFMGGTATIPGLTLSDVAKGANGLWYTETDNFGPLAVNASTISLLTTN